jgi:uncharacterized membrane protein
MAIAHNAGTVPAKEEIQIRKLGLHDLRLALMRGWDDFNERRGDLFFLGLIYPVVSLLAAMFANNAPLLPLIFPVATGAILMGPAAASGFYELARRRELGLDSRWRHFFDAARGPAGASMAELAGLVAMLFVLWILAAGVIYLETLGTTAAPPATMTAFVQSVLNTPQGWMMIIVGNLVGFGFALATLAMTVVSFPMLVDRPVGVAVALRTSLRVSLKNPMIIAAWGLIVVGLLVLGAIPAFVGLAVVLPVLGYATWHLYTRAVVRPHGGAPEIRD